MKLYPVSTWIPDMIPNKPVYAIKDCYKIKLYASKEKDSYYKVNDDSIFEITREELIENGWNFIEYYGELK